MLAAVEDQPVDLPTLGALAQGAGTGLLIAGHVGAAGVLIGMLTRGPALAVGLGLVWALVVENLLRGVADLIGGSAVVTDHLPGTRRRLAGRRARRARRADRTPGVQTILTGGTAVVVLVGYLLVFAAAGLVLVRTATSPEPGRPGHRPGRPSSPPADLALADRHLPAAGERTAGHRHPRAAEGAHPLAEGVDLGGGEVARQLHHVRAELLQRHLALAVADRDVVDGGVADDPGDPPLLLGDQAAHPVRGALTDQHDARAAEHPVDGVELTVAGDAGGDPPVAAHALEHPDAAPGWPSTCR